jgi:hypothetical protein
MQVLKIIPGLGLKGLFLVPEFVRVSSRGFIFIPFQFKSELCPHKGLELDMRLLRRSINSRILENIGRFWDIKEECQNVLRFSALHYTAKHTHTLFIEWRILQIFHLPTMLNFSAPYGIRWTIGILYFYCSDKLYKQLNNHFQATWKSWTGNFHKTR